MATSHILLKSTHSSNNNNNTQIQCSINISTSKCCNTSINKQL